MNNSKDILITGANGQLGMEFRALEKRFPRFRFFFVGKDELSISDYANLDKYFSTHSFSYCINCAAYTAVDKAETETELAFEINTTAAGNLAVICKKYKTQFIHISTDYVFNGNGTIAYKETDQTEPLGVYGASKHQGEIAVLNGNDQSLIFRTSWVYSSFGKNFVKTMLRLMGEKERISVVNDQIGCPTYAADLATAILEIISGDKVIVPGIYHYCNEGIISWYEFAVEIKNLSNSNCRTIPITTAEYPTPAKRPHFSVLDTTKVKSTFGISIPEWKTSLQTCIDLIQNK